MSTVSNSRQRFCTEIDSNFSVIAPAGVGKTSAIVERIVETGFRDFKKLSSLCVVTYTRKAAEEMFLRTVKLFEDRNAPKTIFEALSKGFFGTIHSFCFSLLKDYGVELELSPLLQIVEDDITLRAAFLRDPENIYRCVSDDYLHTMLRYIDFEDFFRLVLSVTPTKKQHKDFSTPPQIDGRELLNFSGNACNSENVRKGQALFENWQANENRGIGFNPLPYFSKGGKEFQEIFEKTLHPMRVWIQEHLLLCLQNTAEAYLQFRIKQGKLLHSDVILLAKRLLQVESVKNTLGKQPINILLDEAQDTDADQFDFLMGFFGINPQNRFSMVGDPQQSIYGSRTSIQNYLNWHKKLQQENILEHLVFSTTFRCPSAIVEVINSGFPSILTDRKAYQVPFVPLQTPSNALKGEFIKLSIRKPFVDEKNSSSSFVMHEIATLAEWVKGRGFEPSEVAFLAPRNAWLLELKQGFEELGLPFQLHSSAITWREKPFFAWIYALVHMIAYPEDGFELVGILQAWFGVSDRAIVDFVYGNEPKPIRNLQILTPTEGNDAVSNALNALYKARKEALYLSFYAAVSKTLEEFKLVDRLLYLKQTRLTEIENIWDWLTWQFSLCQYEEGHYWQNLDKRLKAFLDQKALLFENKTENAYQGYTLHKAKGLEWPIVILSFFFRPYKPHTLRYPYVFENRIVFDNLSEEKDAVAAYRKAEFERLLYVGFTRAKRTLVCVDDTDLWEGKFSLGQIFSQSKEK